VFRVGSAQVDITPDREIDLAGSFELRRAGEVLSPLYASAVVLDDGELRVVWVACDLLWISDGMAAELRRRIAEGVGTSAANVFISCTHTHNGPILFRSLPPVDPDPRIVRRTLEGIVRSAVAAAAEPHQARMGYAAGTVEATFNRRFITADGRAICNPGPQDAHIGQPEGPADKQVQAVWFESTEGRILAIVVNFSSHSTLMFSQHVISADFPGEVRRTLQAVHGRDVPVLYLQGACGNTSPVDFLHTDRASKGAHGAMRVGRMIAGEVVKIMAENCGRLADELPIAVAAATIDVPARPPGADDQPLAEAKAYLRDHPLERIDMYDMLGMAAWYFARSAVDMEEGPLRRDSWPVELSVLRLGSVAVAANPAELFVEYQLEIKQKAGAPVMVCELTNGHCGYVLTEKAWKNGSYEARRAPSSKLAPAGGPMIVDATLKLLRGNQLT